MAINDKKPWIACDLDGTLAYYDNYTYPDIGPPIPKMLERVRNWIEQGFIVKIFTARAAVPSEIQYVKEWLARNELPDLEVTCSKDQWMAELWDDNAIQVQKNTGKTMLEVTSERLLKNLCEEKNEETKTSEHCIVNS